MVKKILSVFAIASMMLATSCSNDEFDSVQNGKESTVTFTAQLPDGLQTKSRAYGDGETATRLQYAAYLLENDEWKLTKVTGEATFTSLTTTVNLKLVNGNTYKVVFWADAGDEKSIYDFDKQNAKVTANYQNNVTKNNDENLDAFYKVEEIRVNGTNSKTVELKRPFAQLNIGTADLEEAKKAGREVKKAAIIVSTYTTLDFKTDKVSDEKLVDFQLVELPVRENFPVDGYQYLTMNYLLMGDKESKDVVICYDDNAGVPERTIQAVPLQRNYRTNVYGNLLTSQNDITVTIKPDFDGTHNKPVEAVTAATLKNILTASDNVTLTADYVVTDDWTPIKITGAYTLDGAGHTISGLTDGLFRSEGNDLTVKNLTVANSTLNAGSYNNGLGVGAIVNYSNVASKLELDNCHAVNVTVNGSTVEDACPGCGVLVGYSDAATTTIKKCSVKNSTVAGHVGNAAGIIGMYGYNNGLTVENCTVENVTLSADKETKIGQIIGSVVYGSAVLKDNIYDYNKNIYGRTVEGTITVNGCAYVTAAQLKADLVPDANGVINIEKSYYLTDAWTSYQIPTGSAYIPVNGKITINGKGHTIYNLTQPLLGGNFCSDLTIKDLNISTSRIGVPTPGSGENGMGTGAFVCWMNYKATFENCHLLASEVTGSERAGGLIGYASANAEEGAYGLTVKNCTVEGCEITAVGGAGGIVGYTMTTTDISNSKVEDSTIEATEDRTGKDALAGSIAGTVNVKPTILTNVTSTGNTVKNTGATGYSEKFGRVMSSVTEN